MSLGLRHLLIGTAALTLAACGGGGGGSSAPATPTGGTPPPPPPPPAAAPATDLETKAEAARFLQFAGLGAQSADIDAATGQNAADWVTAQMRSSPTGYRSKFGARLAEDDAKAPYFSQFVYEEFINTNAELRARTAWALSQIIVVNDFSKFNEGYGMSVWMDILDRNAFGNYRDLLQDVTYSPIMGDYLTYLYNQKGDERTGRQPDENYAREILQLFSIGLVELNMDGTPKIDVDGEPIETFDNDDIVGLARVFTGLAFEGTSFRWRDRVANHWEVPMKMFDDYHSPLEKSFLGTTIAANTNGTDSINQALDTIFEHPNLPPFIARQMIQRFTASHPDPAYVERVATAFADGRYRSDDGSVFGDGRRGSMTAMIAAILLDESLHDEVVDPAEGKVREPVLKFVHFARAFRNGQADLDVGVWNTFTDTSDPISKLGQSPLKSPSVFNFYRPGFKAPGTETGEADLTAPELQIVNESAALGYINFMTEYVTRPEDHSSGRLIPDYAEELAIADDAEALVDRLDLKLTAGSMGAETRTAILETLEALPIRDGTNEDRDRRSRVNLAVLMTVVSADYVALD